MDINNYSINYNKLLNIKCDSSSLETLKEHFRNEIYSQRSLERINSLKSLLKVLEKRDCLGANTEDVLQIIMQKMSQKNPEENLNLGIKCSENNDSTSTVLVPLPDNTIEKIHELIISEIGFKWQKLAQKLGVKEGEIDLLEMKYLQTNPRRMVEEILAQHLNKHGKNFENWRSKLQGALRKSHRTDLSEEIDEILINNK